MEIGGKPMPSAAQKIESTYSRPVDVTVKSGQKSWQLSADRLDLQVDGEKTAAEAASRARRGDIFQRLAGRLKSAKGVDVPLVVTADEKALEASVREIATEADLKPQEPRLVETSIGIGVRGGKAGKTVDRELLTQRIKESAVTGNGVVDLPVRPVRPKHETSELKGLKLAGTFTTVVKDDNADRIYNIKRAVALVDGTVLEPETSFSFNEKANSKRVQKGYRVATVLYAGSPAKAVGGGVCQVSSTLYNAAMQAGFQVTERHRHSIPVDDGVPLGRDAAVALGTKDLRFTNSDGLSAILATFKEGRIKFSIYSAAPPEGGIIIKTVKEKLPQPRTRVTNDPSLPDGKIIYKKVGRPGYRVKTEKVIATSDGRTASETVSEDYYAPEGTLIVVGTRETDEEVLRIMVHK